jgi:cytochrome c peroxidase
MKTKRILFIAVLSLALTACGGGSDVATASNTDMSPIASTTLEQQVEIGDRLFNEIALSAGANLSCASCHGKEQAHADSAGTFLPLGGTSLTIQGLRSSPSLEYLNANLTFRFNRNGDPVGGFTWDGRAASRQAQARLPLFDAKEMANTSEASLAAKVRGLPYFAEFAQLFGVTDGSSDADIVTALTRAIETYQINDPDYERFSSKFDAVEAGTATFTAQESRGLAIFNDPQRGNCASCHSNRPDPKTGRILFTNFEFHALGIPRNQSVATQDPGFFDLGLCGPQRTDLSARTDLCGKFKVPTLRNIAVTAPYFHNAKVNTLQEAVSFYATRDTDPDRWYPTAGGMVKKFDDLPTQYHGNINVQAPFAPLANSAPRLSPQDVADMVAFLSTLTDGYRP